MTARGESKKPGIPFRFRAVIFALAALFYGTRGMAMAQEEYPMGPPDGGPVQVRVSILLVDIFRILDSEQEIEADLFVRIEWQDPRLARPGEAVRWLEWDEFWAPNLQPLAPRDVNLLMPEGGEVDQDGNVSYTQRYIGTFSAPTLLEDFPFDSHEFRFQFIVGPRRGAQIEVVLGPIAGQSESLTIPDWFVDEGKIDIDPIFIADVLSAVPGFSYTLRAKRKTAFYLAKVLFPLIVIVMMSWTVFWAPPAQIGVQFGFAATSILTVIAYRFALSGQVPPVPYETRLDIFLNGAFALSFLALVEVIVTARLIYRDRTAIAERVDTFCRWMFPLLLVFVSFHAFYR